MLGEHAFGQAQLANDFRNELSAARATVAVSQTTPVTAGSAIQVSYGANVTVYHAVLNISGANSGSASVSLLRTNRLSGDVVQLDLNWSGTASPPSGTNPSVSICDNSPATVIENFPAPGILGGNRSDFFLFTGSAWQMIQWPPTPLSTDVLNSATPQQYQAATAISGFQAVSAFPAGTLPTPAGSIPTTTGATTLVLPASHQNNDPAKPVMCQLQSAIIARPMVLIQTSYAFGAVISPPTANAQGVLTPYRAEPVHSLITVVTTNVTNTAGVTTSSSTTSLAASGATIGVSTTSSTDSSGNNTIVITNTNYGSVAGGFDPFYWSKNASQVYATQSGVITITWAAVGTGAQLTKTYVISTSPVKPARQIFWTENGFNGPHVQVPTNKVNAVNVVYNPSFPQYVTNQQSYRQPNQNPLIPVQTQTFWYDSSQGIFSAYNSEGLVFVEYLGNLIQNGAARQQLDTEIIQVTKEVAPTALNVEIGDILNPPNGADPTLSPSVAAGAGVQGSTFVQKVVANNGTSTLYAVRQTTAQPDPSQLSNEVLIYWEQGDAIGVPWPKYYAGYTQTWPSTSTELYKYTLYARPDSGLYPAESVATGVQLQTGDNPTLVYQDDPAKLQAQITSQAVFYTNVTAAAPTNRALISFNNSGLTWFQRIYSKLDSTYGGYATDSYNNPVLSSFPNQGVLYLNTGAGYQTGSGGYNISVTDPNTFATYQNGVNYVIGQNANGTYISPIYKNLSLDSTYDAASGLGANGAINCLALQSDGYLLAGGAFTQFNGQTLNHVARLTPTGSVDPSFLGGSLTGVSGTVNAIAVQPNGQVLIGGSFGTVNGMARNNIARLNSDGSLDMAFQNSLTGANAAVRAIAVQPDGNIVIGGDFTTVNGTASNYIARLSGADGSRDVGFAASANNSVYALAVAANSTGTQTAAIYAGGAFTQMDSTASGHLASLTSAGALTTGYLSGLSGADNTVFCLALRSNGELYIGGSFANVNSQSMNRVALLTTAGAIDPGFLASPLNGVTGTSVSSIAIQNDGKLLIGGTFTAVDNSTRVNLARLNTDGSLDSFQNGVTGPNGPVNAIAVNFDATVLIGGAFSSVNSTAGAPTVNNNIARFLPSGSQLPGDVTVNYAGITAYAYVGQRVLPPATDPADTYLNGTDPVYVGYIRQKAGTEYDPLAYSDPFVNGFAAAAQGAIIPVNAHFDANGNPTDQLEVWWYKQVVSQAGSGVTYWPATVQTYALQWPPNPPQIVLASNSGSGPLNSLQAAGSIYYQNDSSQPGYNPNEEHALMIGGAAYALRDDLNLPDGFGHGHYSTSDPYVLVAYTEADGRPAMTIFQVLRTNAQYQFNYLATAGTPLQAPLPLPLLPPPVQPGSGTVANYEDPAVQSDLPAGTFLPATTDAYYANYQGFTWTDRTGAIWIYRGPHGVSGHSASPTFSMRYFYQTQPGFFFPTRALNAQPPIGTITPYLRAVSGGNYVGDPVTGLVTSGAPPVPLPIVFTPVWPAAAPQLPLGQTLTGATMGLTAIRGQSSAQILYQQSIALDSAHGVFSARQKSARLFDPTVQKAYLFPASTGANPIPASVNTSAYQGLTYFPNLPPNLSQRLYFDPNLGSNGGLVLLGQYIDDPTGEKYLLLNLLSPADKATAYGLCSSTDANYGHWTTAIDGLSTTLNTFVPDPAKAGTFTIETGSIRTYNSVSGSQVQIPFGTLPLNTPQAIDPYTLPEVNYSDTAVDSYAVSASGGGTGYVVVAVGNGIDTNFTPAGNPVSLAVFQVTKPLYTGQLKVILPENPLDEKQILQHTGDFAGHPEDYDFEWRYQPAPSNGTLPTLYSYAASPVLGDSTGADPTTYWRLISDPGSDYGNYRLPATDASTVRRVLISTGGSGYTSAATVSFTGGGGSGATGQLLVVGGVVAGVNITNPGTGYTTAPAVTIFDVAGGGSGAAGTAVVNPLVSLPTQQITINDGNGSAVNGTYRPNAILRRLFATPSTIPAQLYLSMNLGPHDSALVYINSAPVAAYNLPATATGYLATTPQVVPPASTPAFNPLSLVFQIPATVLIPGAANNVLTVELYTTADVGAQSAIDVRVEGSSQVVNLTNWLPANPGPTDTLGTPDPESNPATHGLATATGRNRYLISGASVLTLSDNYFIMRYRANSNSNSAYSSAGGWSNWTSPALAEGWIKRALQGINPFDQRITDLYDNAVSTDVSLVQQAGTRYEGNIALNLSNINSVGLISIYETILKRGESLSIAGAPPLNYAGANNALLLAAGYLSDLYSILGNEAEADSQNPTISYSTSDAPNFVAEYGNVATSLFSFQGEVATLLDEQLALLRGRDDMLAPGVTTAPVYNRLYWNYTNGIATGQAIYALNYDITDVNSDGVINAKDAAAMYPQGHGDAYGHFLTALTGYYGLLANPNFSWIPQVETVNVLGVPLAVNYQDERKFAADALAVARTGAAALDLTYRAAYKATNTGWTNLVDGKRDPSTGTDGTANPSTGVTRYWGVDDWACRAGQGAYFNWITANSLLPAIDPNPADTGIQKVDRTTVPELAEIVTQAAAIQQTLDNADTHLNPLGLANGALAFDISPTGVDAGKTHFEQIYTRAVTALTNAADAFNNAAGSTQFLRQQQDSLADEVNTVNQQEQAFTNQLVDLYGTPYTSDIGPGQTYVQGYTGPDLLHYNVVDDTDFFDSSKSQAGDAPVVFSNIYKNVTLSGPSNGSRDVAANANAAMLNFDPTGQATVNYTIDSEGRFLKPSNWTGERANPGKIQSSISALLQARQNAIQAFQDYQNAETLLNDHIAVYNVAVQVRLESLSNTASYNVKSASLQLSINALQAAQNFAASLTSDTRRIARAVVAGMPTVVGVASDPSFAARSLALFSSNTAQEVATYSRLAAAVSQAGLQVALAAVTSAYNAQVATDAWTNENAQLFLDLQTSLQATLNKTSAIDTALRAYGDAQSNYNTLVAQGLEIQNERLVFRQHTSAIVQGYRTRDLAFRSFRDEALERYRSLFDLAALYTYLSARAYDYETGLLDPSGNSAAANFYAAIAKARSLGVISNGTPQFANNSMGGDPGLSAVLAEMNGDWQVVKSRLGFNNPDNYSTTFSLRGEKYRILPSADGDQAWQNQLQTCLLGNILDDPDVARYCLQAADPNGLPTPGLVIPFQTTITPGYNFFGKQLAAGDHTFTSSSFATKIRSCGIAFSGYAGMDAPTSTAVALSSLGASSPASPNASFTDPQSLSATPYVYLIPTGVDSMRSPPLGDSSIVRTWQVQDQAVPLPFNISGSTYSTQPEWVSESSLTEPMFAIRKHQAFRAVPAGTVFNGGIGFTNARLIGRSVWNSQWKLVIPGNTLLADPNQGLQIFLKTVKDIQLYLQSYSYSGN